MAGAGICLQVCGRFSQCPDEQLCVAGSCIGPAATRDSGATGEGDAGGRDAGERDDGGQSPIRDAEAGDAGALPPDPPLPVDGGDGGDAGSGDLACMAEQRPCCAADLGCSEGLICHIDDSCIPTATADDDGVATLAALTRDEFPVATDGEFIYGIAQRGLGDHDLVRWPIAGGPAQVLASGLTFLYYLYEPVILIDGGVLYFVAIEHANDLGYTLFRMPSDGSTEPETSGSVGKGLAQSATHLYFPNPAHSRVIALPKASFGTSAAREEVYVSNLDAQGSIMTLAVNSTTLFVAEYDVPTQEETFTNDYTIHAIDTASRNRSALVKSDRLGPVAPYTFALHATDGMLFVRSGQTDRIDLESLEVTPLPGNVGLAVDGGHLIELGYNRVDEIDLSTMTRTEVLRLPFDFPLWISNTLYGRAYVMRHGLWTVSLIRIER